MFGRIYIAALRLACKTRQLRCAFKAKKLTDDHHKKNNYPIDFFLIKYSNLESKDQFLYSFLKDYNEVLGKIFVRLLSG